MSIIYQSKIDFLHKEILDEILFFNKNQKEYEKNIIESVEQYGIPKINETNGEICISLESNIETHSLFMLEKNSTSEELLGVALIIRGNTDEAILLHLAINNKKALSNQNTLSLILKVKEYLSNFSEIKKLKIFYSNKTSYLKIH